MKIGLIGTGNVGEVLAKRLVEIGHDVKAANSRGPDSLQAFAQRTGAVPAGLAGVLIDAELVIVAIPIDRVPLLKASFQSLPASTVVVDTSNYQPMLGSPILEIDQGMTESAWVSSQLGVPVVKAFNAMTAYSMAHKGRAKGAKDRIAVPIVGDQPRARSMVERLVEDLGFDAFDAGNLAQSWRQQPGQPTYAADPTLAEIAKLLKRADREKAPKGRDKAMALMMKLPRNFPVPDLIRVARLFAGLDTLRPRSWLAMLRLTAATLRPKLPGAKV